MTDNVTTESIEDASGVVHTIMLWRIYDTLLLILGALGGDAAALGKMHEAGQFIGPIPSLNTEIDDD